MVLKHVIWGNYFPYLYDIGCKFNQNFNNSYYFSRFFLLFACFFYTFSPQKGQKRKK